MNTTLSAFSFKKQANAVEWKLLVFLILFMDVKLVVKVAAIILVYLFQPNFKFGFNFKNSRLPVFYLLVIGLAILNWVIYRQFTVNYSVVLLTGILFWLACILAIHQVKLFVEGTEVRVLHNTLLVFFVLNIAASILNLSVILWEIGFRNPFHYQGNYQKYFINTGDYIKGLTFDSSTTNALINSFGLIYFLYRKKYGLSIACMALLLLTASNFTNAILLLVFFGMFLFKSNREQKSIMVVCALMLVIFLAKFSQQNDRYINEIFDKYVLNKSSGGTVPEKIIPIRERPDSLLDNESRKEKIAVLTLDSFAREEIKRNAVLAGPSEMIHASVVNLKERPELPGDSIHTAKYQSRADTTTVQWQIISYANKKGVPAEVINSEYNSSSPGKLLAMKESVNFFKEQREKIFTGDGMGNFSSKLAFRATGLKITGGYPQKYIYSSQDFLNNHFSLYTFFFTKRTGAHSLLNSPDSVYDQLLTEYGLIGLAAFALYYAGFFFRNFTKLSYGLPLLAVMLAAFLVGYWFEQLSIVLLFELMMFLDIKEHTKTITNE